jgi:phosphoserine aminotransferase
MSSDFLSRPIRDWSNIGCVFACAQKNFGLAGMTVVIVRKDLLERPVRQFCPLTLDLRIQVKHTSMYNTPPTFIIHFANIIFKWIEAEGGVEEMDRRNEKKAAKLYEAIDRSPHFENRVTTEVRSEMNVTFFRVSGRFCGRNDALDKRFLDFCENRNIVSLKGFGEVGGFRASIYNAMSDEGVDALIRAIEEFSGFD